MEIKMRNAQIMQFFAYHHLKSQKMQDVSKKFKELAEYVDKFDNTESDVAIRKLLEAKDAAVRAAMMS